MREIVVVSAVRTPVGRAFKGTLRTTRPDELAARALVLEVTDPRQAVDAWGRYLARAGDGAPFADHARAHALASHKKPTRARGDGSK